VPDAPLTVLFAPDSFKGSLTSLEVARTDGGTLTVLAGGSEHAMDEKQASGLFVRRAA